METSLLQEDWKDLDIFFKFLYCLLRVETLIDKDSLRYIFDVFSIVRVDVTSSKVGQDAVNVDVRTFDGFSTSEKYNAFLKFFKVPAFS